MFFAKIFLKTIKLFSITFIFWKEQNVMLKGKLTEVQYVMYKKMFLKHGYVFLHKNEFIKVQNMT